jgi:uncharacterized repeat protein (TIGR03837 family)
MMQNQYSGRWDIFCTVVDNYGDIGVCWRLARQLAAEHGLQVRLWVDRLDAFRRICPEVAPGLAAQHRRGVEIRHWADPFPEVAPAEVVVEAFACTLPANYVAAMAAGGRKPVWINLEYLSAEEWVRGCHGLASPHPQLPLVKHFFFPGFGPGTGGLVCEQGLLERRRAFQLDQGAQAAYWEGIGVPAAAPEEVRASLFCYANSAVSGLLAAWAHGAASVLCLVPEGVAAEAISAFFGQSELQAGRTLSRGRLQVRILPFLEQDLYDRLLWACDCNFVRGEDSFVRAQWAAKPMAWHIYPQEDEAHRLKLDAFLDLYCGGLPPEAAAGLRAFWSAWNRRAGAGEAWPGFWRHRAILEEHAGKWPARLLKNGDLAANLVEYCTDRL